MIAIIDLYYQAFGIKGGAYPKFDTNSSVPDSVYIDDMDVYGNTIGIDENKYSVKSIFGTPIHMPFKIDDYWLPNEPLVTLTGGKNIVKTVVTGLKGTVKEEISTNDIMIVIKGIVTNDDNDDYPEADMSNIRKLCEAEGMRSVVNKLLRIYGVDNIVIESYNIFGIAGHQSQQAYQINAWSDRPVELILREGV
ncbi:MAG: DUF6046 domain-containing protein [Bacteroidales bacterium]|nr:DUF6046 domain-containing protein [Bacteroidales bacterium]